VPIYLHLVSCYPGTILSDDGVWSYFEGCKTIRVIRVNISCSNCF